MSSAFAKGLIVPHCWRFLQHLSPLPPNTLLLREEAFFCIEQMRACWVQAADPLTPHMALGAALRNAALGFENQGLLWKYPVASG